MEKNNSVKRDLGFAAIGIAAFYLILMVANVLDSWLGIDAAYNLVSVASVFLKVTVASALSWVVLRLSFKNTLGKDFGDILDRGWNGMKNTEKTRWMIGVFVALFLAIIVASQ